MKKTAYLILSVVILTTCISKEECGNYYITFTPEELNFFPYRDGQTVSFITDKDTVKEFKITVNRDYISDVNPFFNSKCKKYFFDELEIEFNDIKNPQWQSFYINTQKIKNSKPTLRYFLENIEFGEPVHEVHPHLTINDIVYSNVYEYKGISGNQILESARLFYTTEKGIIKIIHPDGTYWTLKK